MDSITLEIFKSLFTSVAEEMGACLRRTSFSPNIKERRDYSCAVFDSTGRLIAQGDHMPVHLGSMPMSVTAAIQSCEIHDGDVIILNDPFKGGTHLPDVTLVAPVYSARGELAFYTANRAHHADIGGATPGSMGMAQEIYQEGFRIPPCHLKSRGSVNEEFMGLFLSNVRVPEERKGDLTAQLGALAVGEERLKEIIERYGLPECRTYASHLVDYADRLMRATIARIPDGEYTASDVLDDDGAGTVRPEIKVSIKVRGDQAKVDFAGSSPQVTGPVNAVEAITISAVYYVFRCLIKGEVPASAGILGPIKVDVPPGTIVSALPPAPVAGGNVETSQRIVDVLLRALAPAVPDLVPAASQGTMNNLTIGGWDPLRNRQFAYYETIAGGMGARPSSDGMSGVHTHMTNSLNTPVEALEFAYPLRVTRYGIRRGSGGKGRFKGGDGVTREIELLTDATVSLLSDRRETSPYGLKGGRDGKSGAASITSNGRKQTIRAGKFTVQLKAGDRLTIDTPGGGGYGESNDRGAN